MKILQGNIPGLHAKTTRVLRKLKEGSYDVFIFQETFLTADKVKRHGFTGFYLYHKEREADGSQNRGGATIGVRDGGRWTHRKFHESSGNSNIESITVVVGSSDGMEEVYITSLYIKPKANVSEEELRRALPFEEVPRNVKWVVGTDANGHHTLWDKNMKGDKRGDTIVDVMISEDLLSENDPSIPTRVEIRSQKGKKGNKLIKSSPDITLTKNLSIEDWRVEPNVDSDHMWISFEVGGVTSRDITKRKFWVTSKWNREQYGMLLDKFLDIDFKKSVDSITDCVLRAMKCTVPKGNRKEVKPLWSEKMTKVQKEAEVAQERARTEPTKENVLDANTKKEEMHDIFREEKKRLFWEKFNDKTQNHNIWSMLRNRQIKHHASSNAVIKTEKGVLKTHREKAEAFVRKFSKVSERRGPVMDKVKVGGVGRPFTWDEFICSLKRMSRRKAVGPDEIPIEAVEYMSEKAKRILLDAMNKSFLTGDVPGIWRRGTIIPLLKPGKDDGKIDSYRPVTLTSQISKLMERMIARRIVHAIDGKLSNAQFGFRAGLSTVDAIMEIIDELVRAYDAYEEYDKEKKSYTFERAIMLACDFSSAFDTIGHHAVMGRLKEMGCGEYEMRWVRSFLSGRQGRVLVGDKQSKWVEFEAGVPQGTVLGPLLFIVAIDDLLKELVRKKFKTVTFADDLTVVIRNMNINYCVRRAQAVLNIIENWTKKSCMILNVDKTYAMVISHSHNTSERFDLPTLGLKYKNEKIKIYRPDDDEEEAMTFEKSRILGIHLDQRLSMKWQFEKVKSGATVAKQALSLLGGQTMGAGRKQLCEMHVMLGRSRELYAVEAYWHLLSSTSRERICQMDREGIRKAVGLQPGASEESLLYESGLRPLDIEVTMRQAMYYERVVRQKGSQYERACRQPPLLCKQNSNRAQYIQTPMNICKMAAEMILTWGGQDPAKIKRECIYRVSPIAPWERDESVRVIIVTEVAPGKVKKKTPVDEQHRIVKKVVEECLEEATVQGWTDGSSFVRLRMSGAAGSLSKKGSMEKNYKGEYDWMPLGDASVPAGPLSCSFTSEGVGLREMLKILLTIQGEKIVLFVDCQSLLKELDEKSIDQKHIGLIEIWRMMLVVGRRNVLKLQHIWSHCNIKQSDIVDERAKFAASEPQDGVTTAYRDSKALIREWGREKRMERMANHEVAKNDRKTEEEDTWGREEQVVAAQIRDLSVRGNHVGLIEGGGNVSSSDGSSRVFDGAMPLSCRLCALRDHVEVKKLCIKVAPRSSKDSVKCEKCGHIYATVSKYNRHLGQKADKFKECRKQSPIYIKEGKGKVKGKAGKVVVERRPHTGELESLDHVVNKCLVVQKEFGPKLYIGTLKQKVDKIVKIRIHLDGVKKEKEMAHKRRNVGAAEGAEDGDERVQWDPGGTAKLKP